MLCNIPAQHAGSFPPPLPPPPTFSWVHRLAAAGVAGLADLSQGALMSSELRLVLEKVQPRLGRENYPVQRLREEREWFIPHGFLRTRTGPPGALLGAGREVLHLEVPGATRTLQTLPLPSESSGSEEAPPPSLDYPGPGAWIRLRKAGEVPAVTRGRH